LSTTDTISAADVVGFWREAGPEKWFKKDAAFDRAIEQRFGALHAEAAAGKKDSWAKTPEGALALLLLLDQFSRNLFRGSAKTYAQDAKAREIAGGAVAAGLDKEVDQTFRPFFCLPFMHSESVADLAQCVALSHSYASAETLKFARHHQGIIHRFGRFPHRNEILGRHSTPAEREFLESGGFGG
jgi:uncharacterized protein (DUF924 family)